MPGMISFFERWYDLLLLAAVLGLVGWYFAAYARAVKPRNGTLEWIGMHDRPEFTLSGKRFPMTRGEILPLLTVCLFSAAAWAFAAFRAFQGAYTGAVSSDFILSGVIHYAVLPVVTTAGAYFLFKSMFGSTTAAVFGCAILALDLSGSLVAQSVVAVASVFLWRFMTADYADSFGASCPDLILTAAVMAAGCYFEPYCAFFAVGVLLLIVGTGLFRFRGGFHGYTAVSVLVYLAVFAVVTVLVFLPAALISGMAFPRVLISADFYQLIWLRLQNDFADLAGRSAVQALLAMRYDWILLLTGFLAVLFSLAALFRRSCPQGLLLAVGFVAAAFMWLLGGIYAMPVFCTAGLCFLWAELRRRNRGLLAGAGAACLVLMLLVFYVLSWIL